MRATSENLYSMVRQLNAITGKNFRLLHNVQGYQLLIHGADTSAGWYMNTRECYFHILGIMYAIK